MLAESLRDSDIPKKDFVSSIRRQTTAGTCLEHIGDGSVPAPFKSAKFENKEDAKKKQAIRS